MSQSEIIQALKNLGNKATSNELLDEYMKIHYNDKEYREKYIQITTQYNLKNLMVRYIGKLKRDGIIKSRKINIPYGTKNNVIRQGSKKNWVEYYLVAGNEEDEC